MAHINIFSVRRRRYKNSNWISKWIFIYIWFRKKRTIIWI